MVNLLLILLLAWQGQLLHVLTETGRLLNAGQVVASYKHHIESLVTGVLVTVAGAFTLCGSYFFCRDTFIASKRAKDSRALPFDDALAMSYLLHIVLALGILFAARS